jgi:predicted deacylase
MKSNVVFNGQSIAPNSKYQGYLPIPDSDVTIPVTVINGKEDGKRITITSGVHSGEYVGIQCAIELAQELQPEKVHGLVTIVHPCNTTGFRSHVSYVVPEDGKNLGRCFPGNQEGTLSDRIGYAITQACLIECDFALDMHGGDLHERLSTFVFAPKNGDQKALDVSHEIAKFMNVKYVVLTSSGLTGYCLNRGFPSIVLERGDRGLWSPKEVILYKQDAINILKYFGVLDGNVNFHGPVPYYFTNVTMDYSPVDGCFYCFVELDQQVHEGDLMGEVRDFHGLLLHEVRAKYDCVIHSYWTSLSINKGQLMVGYGS